MWDLILLVGAPLLLAVFAYFGRGRTGKSLGAALRKSAHTSRQVRYEERKVARGEQLQEDMAQPPTDLDDLLDEAEALNKKNQRDLFDRG